MSTPRAAIADHPTRDRPREIELVGLAWDDPRGYGPLAAAEAAFVEAENRSGATFRWDIQPLAGFESRSIGETAQQYDLIVMDHPHTAEAHAKGLLLPLGEFDDQYVGPTRTCYRLDDQQWAAPIDASCHVAAWAEGVDGDRLQTWDDVFAAADGGLRVAAPLAGVHGLMALLSLIASYGREVTVNFAQESEVAHALSKLRELAGRCPRSLDWNPIETLAAIGAGRLDYIPCTFAYEHFAKQGVAYGVMPAVSSRRPARAVLGGAGLAVSAYANYPDVAVRFARFAASGSLQQSSWAQHGGQPAHCAAWDHLAAERPFYRTVRPAIESAFVRPVHPRWNAFQSEAGMLVEGWLRSPTAEIEIAIQQLQAMAAACLQ